MLVSPTAAWAAKTAEAQPAAASHASVYGLLAVYCGLIVLASLFGGWLPNLIKLTHTRMQTLVSGVGGLMLGIAVFQLLPHAVEETGSVRTATYWMMAGLLGMFFLIRAFHFHFHGPAEPTDSADGHGHDCGHDHHADATQHLGWVGVAFGLGVHTMIDGLILGASVHAGHHGSEGTMLFGLGTFLAILFHKPLDAVSITSLMARDGWSPRARNLVNIGFAMMCPLGAVLFLTGVEQLSDRQHLVVGCALGFSAGVFLCISLGDLLPEVELHSHHRLRLSVALLAGIALAWAVEQMHVDGHNHDAPPSQSHTELKTHRVS